MIGDTAQIDNKELIEWIDGIPFSRPARNLTRDFSDAVLTAEVLKLYYPRHVELHNYVPANSINTKKENWKMLNRKVLVKLDMKLSSDTIHQLANGSQGAIEKLLTKLRVKVLRDDVEIHKPKVKDVESNVEGEKIGDSSLDDYLKLPVESQSTDNETCKIKSSKFTCLKRGILIVFNWILCFFRIWNIFNYCTLPRFRKHALADVTTGRIEEANDENVQRTIYSELKQELREKEEVISTLNHKIAYLESSMKLKDLRISSLAAQILQNAVEMDQSAKSQSIDGARAKLRSRSHNFHETKAN
ncbi:PREDICTED: sperm flagellar protein 1-like [Cyphomyrmex costatus]|uniref:Sperm flagellar protein 1 n=1 Tax=Cyphomyrmex costatus TaxID=456900 RepID=A0A151IKY4_9HYME|nr:PREDICTED: sperm flagellar protein 1-like [Cyphomyrmex costatus]KYN05277.1 Sperm flagellar protein 1 [Cyphomyrmex costatus]